MDMEKIEKTDEELLDYIISGSNDALIELWERVRSYALSWARRWAYCEDDVEDITQLILVRLWKSAHTFRRKSSFRVWFYTICRSETICWAKKEARRNAPLESIESAVAKLANGQNLLSQLEARSDIRFVERERKRIPKEFRDVLLLHYAGFSHRETAKILKLPSVSAAKSRYMRAGWWFHHVVREVKKAA